MIGVVMNDGDPPYTNENETQKRFDDRWALFLRTCGSKHPAPSIVDTFVSDIFREQAETFSRQGFVSFEALIDERIPLENERLQPTIRKARGGGTYVSQFLSKAFREFYESAPSYLLRAHVPEVLEPVEWPDFIALDAMVWCNPRTDEDSPWKSLRDLLGDHYFVSPDGRALGDHHIVRGAYHRFGAQRRDDMYARVQIHIPRRNIVEDQTAIVKAQLLAYQRQQQKKRKR